MGNKKNVQSSTKPSLTGVPPVKVNKGVESNSSKKVQSNTSFKKK